ncbi:MAG: efflux RND transporter permease subunit [Gammaproteobacteria bacterium]|nr:efflux RND transporter permease subunit [Gammaproteobacteria bacterium]
MTEEKNNNNSEQELNPDLGIAGRITKQFINSPVTPLLMMAFLAIGLLGLFFTPRQEDPKISVPMVDIYVQYAGASSKQVTSLVTDPLSRIMSEIPGVRHVYSATQRGGSVVTVRFEVGEDMGESIVKVHDKIQSNLDLMPPGVAMPLVKPVSIDDVPTVTITLWSKDVDDGNLRTLGFDVLQRLEEVPNSGKGFVVGGRSEQVRIEVKPERLTGYDITLPQIAQTIKTANSELHAGSLEGGNLTFSVYTGSFLTNVQEISRLVVGVRNGVPVYLRDVAYVYSGPEETKRYVTFDTGPSYANNNQIANSEAAVTIAIAKKIGSNGVTVSKSILKRLDSLKGNLIPDNVNVEITRDYGKSADEKVNELLTALFEAAVAVSILCLIGLGLRAASVVIVIIPIVVLITIWAAWVIDYTIDRVSLFALVFSIGILVDDATVVVENIFRRWLEAGKTSLNIAIDAVREVGNPTILATLTIIAAMLPMGFVSGLMGPYMRPIPVLGACAMFFSLIAAFIFAPWFAMRVRPQLKALRKAEQREEKMRNWIGKFYCPCMLPLCKNRTYGLIFLYGLIAATFLACSLFYFNIVTVKMLPFDNKPEFNVVINMPEGTALPVTANVAQQLALEIKKIPEVTSLQTYSGTSSPFNFNGMVRHYFLRKEPWQSDIQVMLLDKTERKRSSHQIAEYTRHLLTPIAKNMGAKIQIVEMPPGPPVLQTVVAEIYGPTEEVRRQTARDMTKMFQHAEGVVDVDNYLSEPYEYWRFIVDTEKAVRRGISVDVINQNLTMAMGGYKLGDIKRSIVLEPTFIVLQVPLTVRSQVSRLKNLPIMSSTGVLVPLAELGHFEKALEDEIIYHKDLRQIEYVTGEMEGRLGAPIYGMYGVEDQLENYITPDGVKMSGMPWGLIGPPADDTQSGFEWSGEWTVTYETFRDMGAAFMVALVLIYGLIVWEFKNFAIAGVIMAPIPLTLIGIIPGHWILGAEFTATSMIGFIALAGIIVRNSILLVEFVKQEVASGKELVDAVVAAGQVRMRPIFITALTLMAGAAAIINDPIFQGMAAGLLFGTGVATILTLIVIPLGCISVGKQFYLMNEQPFPDKKEKEQNTEVKTPATIKLWQMLISFVIYLVSAFHDVSILVRNLTEKLTRHFKHNKETSAAEKKHSDDESPKNKQEPDSPSHKKKVAAKKKTVTKKSRQHSATEPSKKETGAETENVTTEKTQSTKKTATRKKRRGIKLKNIEQKQEKPNDEKE